ncbi:hypothetical protein O3G_MSEX014447 [Manduca sexta]|uniref:Coiled-coil domain-containing protein 22 homolog n=1 Tax=Manduca sexta TaxID=7130 RepID=A0A921ZW33_MANSE|nr:hypothetical protein O3G_MSEX014447 [Manduca sexta]
MEEVDSIILHFLRQLNLTIDDSVKSICDLPVEIIIEAVSSCLSVINPTIKVPKKLPFGISHRIEVAAQIASLCKDLGYKNDVGYQTFLYYNETELRQVFMFLIERLPNEGKQTTVMATVPTNKKSILMHDISHKIDEEFKSIWIPPCCKPPLGKVGDFSPPGKIGITTHTNLIEEEIVQKLIKIKELCMLDHVPVSVIPQTNQENKTHSESKDKSEYETDKSLKELKEIAIMLRQKMDTLDSEKNVMGVEFSQAQRSCERVQADLKNVENILSSIGLSDYQDGATDSLLEKVQKNINQLHHKSEDLMSKNLSLKMRIDKVKNDMSSSESERNKCKAILNSLKDSIQVMRDEYDKKVIQRQELKDSYEKLRGGNKRSIYTKRILEIISNVDKQDMEIKKILEDTRQLQKEINSLEGQLERCFSIADETLFRDAKKDDQAKKAYKLLALLHSECNTIVSLVNDMGSLQRDIVDLEENIKTETAKRTEDTLKKIQLDLAKLQEEC